MDRLYIRVLLSPRRCELQPETEQKHKFASDDARRSAWCATLCVLWYMAVAVRVAATGRSQTKQATNEAAKEVPRAGV